MQSKRYLSSILLAGIITLSFMNTLDIKGHQYYQEAFGRALATFAIAKTLNAGISVIQGTEVAVYPGGVGVNIAAGEALDPINDLIERFSWIMLASASSLGIQMLAIEISNWWGIKLLTAITAMLILMLTWKSTKITKTSISRGYQFLFILLLLRFAMPLVAILNNQIYQLFMAEKYQTASKNLQSTSNEVENIQTATSNASQDTSFWENLKKTVGSATEYVNIKKQIDALTAKLSQITEYIIHLIVVFTLQTVILPLLFLWGFIRMIKWCLRLNFF